MLICDLFSNNDLLTLIMRIFVKENVIALNLQFFRFLFCFLARIALYWGGCFCIKTIGMRN